MTGVVVGEGGSVADGGDGGFTTMSTRPTRTAAMSLSWVVTDFVIGDIGSNLKTGCSSVPVDSLENAVFIQV